MKRRSLALAAVAATAVLAAGCGGTSTHSAPRLSAACKREVAVQDAFVHRQVDLGWPNVPLVSQPATLRSEGALLKDLRKVCPGTAKIRLLPR